MKDKLILTGKGFCMGTADVIPGVSGGTMAFILGIYRELIAAIRSFDRDWFLALVRLDFNTVLSRPHFGFIIPIAIGIFSALMFFTRVVPLPRLLLEFPEQIYGLFFGLITGSIFVLIESMDDLKITENAWIIPGLAAGLIVFNMVPTHTPETAWFVFLSGALAICAMILPGISGSFILLILNKYTYIFGAIGYFRFSIIIPFALGAITGLLLFSRVLSYLLNRYYRPTILLISGLLIASLQVLWPFQERVYEIVRGRPRLVSTTPLWPAEFSQTVTVSILLMAAGVIFVIGVTRLSHRKHF